jgi:hypothetical protein
MLPIDRASGLTVCVADELACAGAAPSWFEASEACDWATASEDPRINMLKLNAIQVSVLRIILSRKLTFSKSPHIPRH